MSEMITYDETSVSADYDKKVKIAVLFRVLIAVSLIIAASRFYFLFSPDLSDIILRISLFIVSLGISAGLILIYLGINISYDYSLRQGVLIVSKIINERYRKIILNVKLGDNIVEIGEYESESYTKIANCKKIFFYSANKTASDGKKLAYLYSKENGIVVIEVTEDFLGMLKKRNLG